MDAFFVSVELLRHPELVGQPVVVGAGSQRGVVAAASYEARQFGVHSAMASSRARSLCPHAVFLHPDHAHYSEVGRQVVDVLLKYTPLVEQLSIDESFLDVTGSQTLWGSPAGIAWLIRRDIADTCNLSCSIGVAPNKFLAKLASEHAKPRASPQRIDPGHQVFVVEHGRELEFLHPLPVSALWGVGPATREKLTRIGIHTVGQLAECDEELLQHALGNAHGSHLFSLSHGIDDRPVEPERSAKSIGNEETFTSDIHTLHDLRPHLVRLCESVARRVREQNLTASTLTLKIKFASFQSITRSTTSRSGLSTAPAMVEALWPLLIDVDPSQGVRLLGVHASKLGSHSQHSMQPSLFDDGLSEQSTGSPVDVEQHWTEASQAIDSIVAKFGRSAIKPASALGSDDPGVHPYGPDESGA
jgi:DNA polymerase IV